MSFRPPSFDPCSPSYDPCAASPCNPFPSFSPFATFSFSSPSNSSSNPDSEMDANFDIQPIPQAIPSPTRLTRNPALALIPPPHSAPSLRRTKPCRFYLSPSGCKTARWCNFKHPVGVSGSPGAKRGSVDSIRSSIASPSSDPNDTGSIYDNLPDVRDLDPNWGKQSDDEVHPKFRTQPCRNYILGLCRYGSKCQFIHAPGLFVPGAAEVPTSFPIPAASAPVSVWGAHPGVGAAPLEIAPSAKPEQMSLFYRTKLCKFFNASGTCPHGADCKFIHDPKMAGPTETSWAEYDRELKFGEVPLLSGGAMNDVTNRAGSRQDVKEGIEKGHENGIFKPLWRVVGGGVKIGEVDTRGRIQEEEAEDDDVVLEYQPRDMSAPVLSSPVFTTSNSVRTSPASLHQPYASPPSPPAFTYTPFDPAQYPPHALLRPPSPADMPLDITMACLDASLGAGIQRKRRVVTGADLMRGLGEGEKEKYRPRLTIEVPTRTAEGDDVLDWGMGEEEEAKTEECNRRARSTPPTPRSSGSYLDVPNLPRLPAESP